jgi:hypothetical protein
MHFSEQYKKIPSTLSAAFQISRRTTRNKFVFCPDLSMHTEEDGTFASHINQNLAFTTVSISAMQGQRKRKQIWPELFSL